MMSSPHASSLCVFSRQRLAACPFNYDSIMHPSASFLAPHNHINRWGFVFFKNSWPFDLCLFFLISFVFVSPLSRLPLLPFSILSFPCYFNIFSAENMPRAHWSYEGYFDATPLSMALPSSDEGMTLGMGIDFPLRRSCCWDTFRLEWISQGSSSYSHTCVL